MAEQQAARAGKQSGDGTGSSVATMSTPIFDELLREMTSGGTVSNGTAAAATRPPAEPAAPSGGRRAKPVESKHRAAP